MRSSDKMAYVPQDPFLFHASLQENILLSTKAASEDDFTAALHASCLDHDLEFMPSGLMTEIGEAGGNLSGGQKQRVNLARAAMYQSDLVLMDDPLSALDPKTEKQIIERLIFGLWKERTRIVTTHRLEHLERFDRIVFLEDGKVTAQGTFGELMFSCPAFKRFYFDHQKSESPEKSSAELVPEAKAPKASAPVSSVKTVEEEEQKVGGVALGLYWDYLRAMAGFSKRRLPLTIGLLLLTALSAMLLPIFQNRWISQWTQGLESGTANSERFLLIYAGIGLLTTIACAVQHFYWSRKAIDASSSLHDSALEGVLSTFLRFFDANPSGRILGRFSRDLDAVEKDLSWSLEEAFMAFLNSLGAVFVMLTAMPFMLFVVLPVLGMYWFLQGSYRSCMRETKRIMNKARSPRISSIKEVLEGAAVIRCYRAEDYFEGRFVRALSDYQRAFYGVVLINRWFSIRIPLASSLLSMTASVGVILLGRYGGISEGLAGMALVYAFRFWDSLNWTVRAFGEAEAQMTSVERLESLKTLPNEQDAHKVRSGAPIRGEIRFEGVVASYAPHLPNVLKGTSFTVPAGAKVGVIGRTGAGKSTLFGVLHRFIESKEGEVFIDERNIKSIELSELRESISTIPQNPVLFAGSIRDNLDPLGRHSDGELLAALEKAHVAFLSLGLNTRVSEGGNNFSRGQRQLLCLARALVRRAQVIIVDEATASIDGKTDALIRDVLMEECPGVTVLIIAHKLQSVAYCDMIIEMRDGKVFDTTYPKASNALSAAKEYAPLLA